MENDFATEVTGEGILLTRENVEGLEIVCREGLCASLKSNPKRIIPRAEYIKEILNPMIERREINDGSKPGKFDDRKLRLSLTSINRDKLFLYFGATNYKHFKEDLLRSPEDNIALQQKGLNLLGERYAFFSRAPGVAGLVISADGHIWIGERIGTQDDPNKLNSVTGHLAYRKNGSSVNLEEDLRREAREEFGLKDEDIEKISFVGGYLHPNRGDMDFTFLVNSTLPDSYFSSGDWMSKVSDREHKSLVQIPSYAVVQELLKSGRIPGVDKKFNIFYSTRGALQSLRPNEIAS